MSEKARSAERTHNNNNGGNLGCWGQHGFTLRKRNYWNKQTQL